LEVLILTEKEVKPLLKIEEVLVAVEQAFAEKSNGRTQMPAKSYIILKRHRGDFRTMPAYLEDSDIAGVKIVNVHPENQKNTNYQLLWRQ
jgi:alanine dehydrogenase